MIKPSRLSLSQDIYYARKLPATTLPENCLPLIINKHNSMVWCSAWTHNLCFTWHRCTSCTSWSQLSTESPAPATFAIDYLVLLSCILLWSVYIFGSFTDWKLCCTMLGLGIEQSIRTAWFLIFLIHRFGRLDCICCGSSTLLLDSVICCISLGKTTHKTTHKTTRNSVSLNNGWEWVLLDTSSLALHIACIVMATHTT